MSNRLKDLYLGAGVSILILGYGWVRLILLVWDTFKDDLDIALIIMYFGLYGLALFFFFYISHFLGNFYYREFKKEQKNNQ